MKDFDKKTENNADFEILLIVLTPDEVDEKSRGMKGPSSHNTLLSTKKFNILLFYYLFVLKWLGRE